MTYQTIIHDIKQGKISPVYLLHGEEPFFIDLIEECIEKNILSDEEKAFNQTIFYGEDSNIKSIIDTARKYPMMSERQVVIIREAQSLKKIEELVAYLKSPVASTVLVIAHKYKKLDGRMQLGKLCATNGVVFESKKLYDNQIPEWIGNLLKEYKINSNPEIQTLLAENLGNDLTKIHKELDKLNIPVGVKLDRDLIDKYIGISKEFSFFELQKHIGERNVVKTIKTTMYFAANLKKNPINIAIVNLFSFFNKIYLTHYARNVSDGELLKILKVSSVFFLKDYKSAATRYSPFQCEKVINIIKDYDLRSKGVNNFNTTHEELLKEMCIKIISV